MGGAPLWALVSHREYPLPLLTHRSLRHLGHGPPDRDTPFRVGCDAILEPGRQMRFNHLRRREFITVLGGAAVWPHTLRAQQGERVRRIGVLVDGAGSDMTLQAFVAAFRAGLQKLGWIEGRNLRIDDRWAAGD